MAQTQAVKVRRQVVVDTSIDRAFTVFTELFGDFEPPEHNLLAAPHPADSERREGGRYAPRYNFHTTGWAPTWAISAS
jgi:hypothetical protein